MVYKWNKNVIDYTQVHHLKIKILILNKDKKENK